MTKQEFAKTIKAKYPQYQNVDDTVLADKMVEKYPEYKSKITGTPAIPPAKKGIIKTAVEKRVAALEPTLEAYGSGKQGLASSALQLTGQAAGALGDIGFEAIKKITPGFVKEPVKKAIGAVAATPVAQTAATKYEEWKTAHPEAARNLEATINIAGILPATPKTGITEKLFGKAATVAEKSGLKGIEAEKAAFARELVKPVQTTAIKEAQVARTTEKGFGPFKRSVIEPTTMDLRAEKAVAEVPGVNSKNTYQQNFNIIKDYNKTLAQQLEQDIKNNNFIVSKKEVSSRLNQSKVALNESPLITGDAQKTADKLLAGMKRIIEKNKGDAEGILKSRKEYDAWVLSQKPKAFDAKAENAFSIANREIRQTLNDLLEEKAPNVGVKESLTKQSSIYHALDNITPKAAQEADTAIGRAFDTMKRVVGVKNATVQDIATVVGVGGLGAASLLAPAVAGIGIPTYLTYRAGKYFLKPELRVKFSKLLDEVNKQIPTIKEAARLSEIQAAKQAIEDILNQD